MKTEKLKYRFFHGKHFTYAVTAITETEGDISESIFYGEGYETSVQVFISTLPSIEKFIAKNTVSEIELSEVVLIPELANEFL